MSKVSAIFELIRESRSDRQSTAAARRIVRSCKELGLDVKDTIFVLAGLDYCSGVTGEPYGTKIKRVW